MQRNVGGIGLIVALLAAISGCTNNPLAPATNNAQATAWQANGGQQPYDAQLAELNRRTAQLDANNRDLHAQLAQSQQQTQVFRDQVTLLQRRLDETAQQLRDTQVARQDVEKRLETLQTSVQRRGGAVITANSSLRQSLGVVDIPGLAVRLDGEVVRIELPSDQLFVGGGSQLQPTAYLMLDPVATAIQRQYPRQRIGVEAHTDGGGAFGVSGSAAHQLTATQSAAIIEQLTTRNRLPPQQLFAAAHGANHPRAAAGGVDDRMKNRRIEIVVYPETFDGR